MITDTIDTASRLSQQVPDLSVSVRQMFGIDSDMKVPAFSEPE